MPKKITIEILAQYFLKKNHPKYKLDLQRDISQIRQSANFTLKIHNGNKLVRMYFICLIDSKIADSSNPFSNNVIPIFKGNHTSPSYNYWIGYIVIKSKTSRFAGTQVFKLSLSSPLRNYLP